MKTHEFVIQIINHNLQILVFNILDLSFFKDLIFQKKGELQSLNKDCLKFFQIFEMYLYTIHDTGHPPRKCGKTGFRRLACV
ncbi:hypothetical protein K0M31_016111 [Melipona bicolor]|uniref:Uncharacterized protein n=1 Tax=Melipona bicolor TaxID=60889 RepID=A0AA40KT71_9HYME|nr:hypothetical protein K0M31_016111 [Melipona bicolor]